MYGLRRLSRVEVKNFKGPPSHLRNQHTHFFTLGFFFEGVRNDPMCQKFFDPQTSTRVGDTVSLSYSVVNHVSGRVLSGVLSVKAFDRDQSVLNHRSKYRVGKLIACEIN